MSLSGIAAASAASAHERKKQQQTSTTGCFAAMLTTAQAAAAPRGSHSANPAHPLGLTAVSSPVATLYGATAPEPIPETAAEEFLAFARLSPAERLRLQILKEKGLTEESLAALPPDIRAAIEEEIRQAIEEKMKEKSGAAWADLPAPLPTR